MSRSSVGVSQVSWLLLNEEDIRQARQVIAAAGPDSTVDILGLGAPVELVSDQFFPGTSTLHTELRYVIFVPAILYAMQDMGGVADPYGFLKRKEAELIDSLLKGGLKEGVIGRTRGEALKYWPSMTYWTAFQAYGALGEGQYERAQVLERLADTGATKLVSDDGDETDEVEPPFNGDAQFQTVGLRLFKDIAKATWPDKLTFELTKTEARLLHDQQRKLHPGSLYDELFQRPARALAGVSSIFDLKLKRPAMREMLRQAYLYSRFSMGATYAYRWALCKFLETESQASEVKSEWRTHKLHNQRLFGEWLHEAGELKHWEAKNLSHAAVNAFPGRESLSRLLDSDVATFCDDMNRVFHGQQSIEGKLEAASKLVKQREQTQKGNRSRFHDRSISIPENIRATADTTLVLDLYSYRWQWGRDNAVSMLKGMGK